ncbi:MAG: hypothetical protein VX463_09180 [Pseudomonadota bacterium]|nr:hypothetical protein [Pseudomonadota bacterium]
MTAAAARADTLNLMEYRLEDGVSDEALAEASAPISAWAATRPGFRYRSVTRRADGTVTDLMYWADPASMQAADADFMPSGCGARLLPLMVEGPFRAESMPVLDARMGMTTAEADAAAAAAA